ncbi:pleckstrin homology domain-containing family A member 8 [Brachionus plicatilis]|uniref:Pleckstrin homology domain-containing family A member 8 n=1 Tax=Brachionus plicatilis TaxID=10195 RepID=A0A3M7RUF7_BRAPC|nr:pleckstrin homology domain-containing family A member 8 [Brachionus plicatilis]
MDGYLHKWTNYLKGWQLRYFVLKDGILSYFNNENDSKNGDCKGSYKIFMFDIIVNRSDKTRVDLILANENNLYLKASDYKERQKWLVALASQKAIYPSITLQNHPNDEHSTKQSFQQENTMTGTYDSTYFLKLKQSELKLYCDLLTQQTHDFKNVVLAVRQSLPTSDKQSKVDIPQNSKIDDNSIDSSIVGKCSDSEFSETFNSELDSVKSEQCEFDKKPNSVKKLDELSSNINITCDMLVQIVRNLVILSNTSSNVSAEAVKSLLNETQESKSKDKADISIDLDQYKYHLYHPLYLNQHLNQYNTQNFSTEASSSTPSKAQNLPNSMPSNELSVCSSPSRISVKSLPSRPNSSFYVNRKTKQKNHNRIDMNKMSLISIRNYHIEYIKETALLADPVAEHSSHYLLDTANSNIESGKKVLIRFSDIALLDNNGIPTEFFLNCCSDVFSILDSFGSTAFLPVKIDVYGNINKIKQKYLLDTEKFNSLQCIIKHEIDEKKTHSKNSATDALMWLRRAVWFLREFLSNFSKSADSVMSECVHLSYQKTLRQHHNFVVRSIFSLAMRSLPSKEDFYKRLVSDHSMYLNNKEQFENHVIEEMKLTVIGIDRVINIIKDFYTKNKLDI